MVIQYKEFTAIPQDNVLNEIIRLHTVVFGQSDDLAGRMQEKQRLLIHLALDNDKVIGYKIGYALNREQFYSWLGGVEHAYRGMGIARTLMENQHRHVKQASYNVIQTQTKNQWRNMLILNLKYGFNIIGTFTDQEGEPKIILEKKL